MCLALVPAFWVTLLNLNLGLDLGTEVPSGLGRVGFNPGWFFTVRVVKHWPRLPREAVAAASLAVFEARLDGALSNLGWWKMSLLMAGGLEPDEL